MTVYDAAPFVEPVGSGSLTHNALDTIHQGVNQYGYNMSMPLYLTSPGTHFVNGNIGIGTSNTGDNRLAVNGTISAKKVKVTATGWPDYVFEQDYSLMRPEDLADYIRQNKHLPDVPSADSIHRTGQDVGEMNKILMKKVEELTLYMLQQQQQLIQQSAKIAALEKKLESGKNNTVFLLLPAIPRWRSSFALYNPQPLLLPVRPRCSS
ncbi:hypothetical protein WJU16_01120 [Chitinophaga pollutisoli]|uniref:Uncharacterized protein n=1 Tax=Chitinophaga pollutisoli TaxID=3133966 RepID=A0ABZ2YQB3_9BACT